VVVRCLVSIPVVKAEQEPKRLKTVACQPRFFGAALCFAVEPRGSSFRVGRCYIARMNDFQDWTNALKAAERELDTAKTRTALDTAARS
jgi:hypothetical protein